MLWKNNQLGDLEPFKRMRQQNLHILHVLMDNNLAVGKLLIIKKAQQAPGFMISHGVECLLHIPLHFSSAFNILNPACIKWSQDSAALCLKSQFNSIKLTHRRTGQTSRDTHRFSVLLKPLFLSHTPCRLNAKAWNNQTLKLSGKPLLLFS